MKEIPETKDQRSLDENELEKVNGGEKALVVTTVRVTPPDTGFKVEYSLDKVGGTTPGAQQPEEERVIDLVPDDDTATGYYKMN